MMPSKFLKRHMENPDFGKMTTKTLDRIYLEYSQLTRAKTKHEIELERRVESLLTEVRERDQEIVRLTRQ